MICLKHSARRLTLRSSLTKWKQLVHELTRNLPFAHSSICEHQVRREIPRMVQSCQVSEIFLRASGEEQEAYVTLKYHIAPPPSPSKRSDRCPPPFPVCP